MKVVFYNLRVYIAARSSQRDCVAALEYTTVEGHNIRIKMMMKG
jgi:hypothetical protein